MTKLTDLSQPELDVMLHLAQSKTTNVVVLAADMWRTTPDWQAFDPYPLITYVLDSLSARGLCSFRIEASDRGHVIRRFDMPFDIRLTPKGWELMGYPNKTVEVGSTGRHQRQSLHPGDMTDYVNLAGHTYGGPIEKQTFAEHRSVYPHHVHMYGVQLTMANQAALGSATRTYVRVTPEMEAEVIHAREKLGTVSYSDIAEYAGVPERTVKYVLTDLPRLRRNAAGETKAQGSLKDRMYEAIKVLGTIKDVAELRRIVGMADSEHDVVHVLHSLHTQGRIDFDERGSGMGKATFINIRLHKKGNNVKLSPDPEAESEIPTIELPEPEATTQETPLTAPSAPEPGREAYPLLDALLSRERKRLDVDSKAMAYVTAAEAIRDVDPEEAVRMMRKAEALDVPFPSPIEREYIQYVAAHPKENTNDHTQD